MFQLDGPTLLGLAAVLSAVSNIIVACRRLPPGRANADRRSRRSPLLQRRSKPTAPSQPPHIAASAKPAVEKRKLFRLEIDDR